MIQVHGALARRVALGRRDAQDEDDVGDANEGPFERDRPGQHGRDEIQDRGDPEKPPEERVARAAGKRPPEAMAVHSQFDGRALALEKTWMSRPTRSTPVYSRANTASKTRLHASSGRRVASGMEASAAAPRTSAAQMPSPATKIQTRAVPRSRIWRAGRDNSSSSTACT